jgi:hypothetical protein
MSGLLFFEGCGTADSPAPAVDSSAAFSSHSYQKTAFPFLLNMTYTMIFHNLSLFIFNNNEQFDSDYNRFKSFCKFFL